MTARLSGSAGLRAYMAVLAALLIGALYLGTDPGELTTRVPEWLALAVLFAALELGTTYFHRATSRVGLSVAEAIIIPMIVMLSFTQAVAGVVVAMLAVSVAHRHVGWLKNIFNVLSVALATAAAAAFWHVLGGSAATFGVFEGLAVVSAAFVYAVLTHVFVAGAISIAEGSRFRSLASDVPAATLISLALSIVLGLFLLGAYLAARWMLSMFPLLLLALLLGYRAVVREVQDRERVEHLLQAARSLSSTPSFETSVGKFLLSTAELVSAGRAAVLINIAGEPVVCSVADGQIVDVMTPTREGPTYELASQVKRVGSSVVVAEGENSPWGNWADDLGAKSLIATPLEDESLGCLIAMDRVGAGEFSDDDAKLLEALAQELVLSLGSYRLFAQVSQERERFGRIFSGSKDGICLLDDAGKVLAWNPALERITGYQQSAVVGRELSDTLLIRDANKQRLDAWEFVGADPDAELEIVTNDGPGRWVSVLSGSVSRGKETSWVILVRDRTAEHQAEESKSDFLSTISHELRTPLTSIKGSLQVLAKGQDALPDGVHSQMVEVLQRSSDRLERLLLNLLFVSRVETDGQLSVVTQQIDLESIVRNSVASLLGGHDDVELHIEPGMDATVNAESEGLTQAVEHLLDNARKFCSAGRITVELRRASRFAEVVVTDSGSGIPRAEQERIFERFVRLGDTLTRETQGPGVGLFIVRSVAAAVGGRAWVESEPGEGSAFHLIVPLSRQLRVAPQPAAGAS